MGEPSPVNLYLDTPASSNSHLGDRIGNGKTDYCSLISSELSTWPNSRLLVHMVSNACSASEVTSLGSRLYSNLPKTHIDLNRDQ